MASNDEQFLTELIDVFWTYRTLNSYHIKEWQKEFFHNKINHFKAETFFGLNHFSPQTSIPEFSVYY